MICGRVGGKRGSQTRKCRQGGNTDQKRGQKQKSRSNTLGGKKKIWGETILDWGVGGDILGGTRREARK